MRLAALAMPQQRDLVLRTAASDRELALLAASAGCGKAIYAEIADRAVEEALEGSGVRWPADADGFAAIVDAARARVAASGDDLLRLARNVLAAHRELRSSLVPLAAEPFASARGGIERQGAALVAPGWMRRTPHPWLRQLPKYLKAATRRAERLRNDVERDRRLDEQVRPYDVAYATLAAAQGAAAHGPALERLRWMLEEFRVSLHAQDLRTLAPVSARRLDELLSAARAEARDPTGGRAAAAGR